MASRAEILYKREVFMNAFPRFPAAVLVTALAVFSIAACNPADPDDPSNEVAAESSAGPTAADAVAFVDGCSRETTW
jgi:hypothetical protein